VEKESPERLALELVIAGLVGALAESKEIKSTTLKKSILGPLDHHFRLQQTYSDQATNDDDAHYHHRCMNECGKWFSLLESVLSSY
jgi:hypothetical protein